MAGLTMAGIATPRFATIAKAGIAKMGITAAGIAMVRFATITKAGIAKAMIVMMTPARTAELRQEEPGSHHSPSRAGVWSRTTLCCKLRAEGSEPSCQADSGATTRRAKPSRAGLRSRTTPCCELRAEGCEPSCQVDPGATTRQAEPVQDCAVLPAKSYELPAELLSRGSGNQTATRRRHSRK